MSKKRSAEESAKTKKAMERRFGRLNNSNSDFTPTGGKKQDGKVWKDILSTPKGGLSKINRQTKESKSRAKVHYEKNKQDPAWVENKKAIRKAYRQREDIKTKANEYQNLYREKNREKIRARSRAAYAATRDEAARHRAEIAKKKKDASE
jgi:hypothetical protein